MMKGMILNDRCKYLLVALIVLTIRLIHTLNRVNGMLDEINLKISKLDRVFHLVDLVTDNMALISDKIVDTVSGLIKKIFYKNEKRKDDEINEQ